MHGGIIKYRYKDEVRTDFTGLYRQSAGSVSFFNCAGMTRAGLSIISKSDSSFFFSLLSLLSLTLFDVSESLFSDSSTSFSLFFSDALSLSLFFSDTPSLSLFFSASLSVVVFVSSSFLSSLSKEEVIIKTEQCY